MPCLYSHDANNMEYNISHFAHIQVISFFIDFLHSRFSLVGRCRPKYRDQDETNSGQQLMMKLARFFF